MHSESRRVPATLLFAAAVMSCVGLAAGRPGARAYLNGTTVADFPARCDVRIDVTGDRELLFITEHWTLHVPYDHVNTLEYGQHVGRRFAEAILISPLFLLSKSRKHFVTVGYMDANGRQQALVLQVHKNDVRAVLATLEAKTGRRVEYTDDEARKSRG